MAVTEYDKNGNIRNLERMGLTNATTKEYGKIDALGYDYQGNRLETINELASSSKGFKAPAASYSYDSNGNMTSDSSKGISSIDYNHLNLPQSIAINGSTIAYHYTADGIKIKKTASDNTTEYTGATVYKDGNLELIHTPEGYMEPTDAGYKYVYRIKDHLGNTRVSFTKNQTTGEVDVLNTNDYYPFGMTFDKPVNQNVANSSNIGERYKYNGKELQTEEDLDWYDYGARNYSPELGRWMSMDALAGKHHAYSPYNYALNNPVYFVDPDGNDIRIHRRTNDDGSYTYVITLTGKVVNDSSTEYSKEDLQNFADRIASAFSENFSGEDGEVSFEGVANISVAESEDDLSKTDHAFRIVDQGKIPDGKGGFRGLNTTGRARKGENFVYLSNHIVDRKEATEGKYAGTGKSEAGLATLERTATHEAGHTANLSHPEKGTLDGNLMHQTARSNAGKTLTSQQILSIERDYVNKNLNKGKQKY